MGKNDKHTPDEGKNHRRKWHSHLTRGSGRSRPSKDGYFRDPSDRRPGNAPPSEVDHEARLEELEQQKWEQDNDE